MADGSTKPIEDVELGDLVWAADPESGEEGPREVTRLITGHGDKTLVDIEVDGDTVTGTDAHPIWVNNRGEWVDAEDVKAGDYLIDEDGVEMVVDDVDVRQVSNQTVHNLTVDDIHTFFVMAGEDAILTHNSGSCPTTGPSNTTRTGVKRNNPADWRQTRDSWDEGGYGDILSDTNRGRIAKGKTPVVDDAWVRQFPGDDTLMGEKIPMHHIGGGPITVPLPSSRHLDAHMPGGFRNNPGGPGVSG